MEYVEVFVATKFLMKLFKKNHSQRENSRHEKDILIL